jgi:hypothetical protein
MTDGFPSCFAAKHGGGEEKEEGGNVGKIHSL